MNTMKPVFRVDQTLMCGVIQFGDVEFLVDFDDFNIISTLEKKLSFTGAENEIYPSYQYNYARVTLLDHIYHTKPINQMYRFKNDNIRDLRHINVDVVHEKHNEVCQKFGKVIEYIPGHIPRKGKHANIMKNPMWKIKNKNDEERIIMFCEKDAFCILCPKGISKLREFEAHHHDGETLTFYQLSNGYIQSGELRSSETRLYIHQILTGFYGHGKGTMGLSVDHIDQDPLNNCLDNLRVTTREEQEQNSNGIKEGTKRRRMVYAKDLPEGITQDMMRKNVVYYSEVYNKEKNLTREFFKVEGHVKLGKEWMTSKSGKVSIMDKLAAANKVVDDLALGIYPQTKADQKGLPKYVSIITSKRNSTDYIVYDHRIKDAPRINFKMPLPECYDLDVEMDTFMRKLHLKYPELTTQADVGQ